MPPPDRREITAFSNTEIKRIRSLRDKKHRRAERQFLAEGLRICTEALDAGFVPATLVLASGQPAHPLARQIEDAVVARGGEVLAVPPALLAKLSGKDNPQAVLGIFDEHPTPLASLDRNAADIWLVAQALRDPGNLGTMLRTGDAVGAGGLILIDDCTDPFSVEAVRASMGAIFTQRIVIAPWSEFIGWLRGGPGQLVGTSLNDAIDYRAAEYSAPCFVLTGNEARGLPAEYEAACDVRVKIPMHGKADSLNAAIATAVVAYQVRDRLGTS
ncbi:MAG: RNA methyltransferase [Parasphingorhabdus sp.]|nr:RNA methyltransferase [Parasphingorhabdus sp.]